VFVRLRDTRTGNQLASYIARDRSPEDAARNAGYWIAGWIISRSNYVPSWAQWSEVDAGSLPRVPSPGIVGLPSRVADQSDPESFDPNAVNSLVLAQRAYSHQVFPRRDSSNSTSTDGGKGSEPDRRNHFAALEDFARAVHHSPRYPVARYRRGAVLSTMMFCGGDLASAAGLPDDATPERKAKELPGRARLRYLFGDMILSDQLGAGQDEEAVERWVEELVGPEYGAFPDDMRGKMLRLTTEWSNRNQAAIKWGFIARLRPSERFFWKEFRRGRLEQDWVLLLKVELCICSKRLMYDQEFLQRGSAKMEGRAARREEWSQRLAKLEARVCARALEADSHWQIAYNLACLYSIRSAHWSMKCRASTTPGADESSTSVGNEESRDTDHGPTQRNRPDPDRGAEASEYADRAAECRAIALEWLERCLDRPASDQLVREWVTADGDLKPLKDESEFTVWRDRVRSIQEEQTPRYSPAGSRPVV
jgi:hypothetical protein